MTLHDDPRDAQRYRNLQRMAQVLHLPPRADAERQARWQEGVLTVGPQPETTGVSFMKRHPIYTFAASGLAAVLVLAVWVWLGHAGSVSAAVIFQDFKAALAQSLSIRLEHIDLGSVHVHGDILLDRAGSGPNDDRQYAEVHVRFNTDNPEWEDLDAVITICQTPDDAWQFVRGNGGGVVCATAVPPDGTRKWHATPTEYLLRQAGWEDFAKRPLDGFGAMPMSLGFSCGGSAVEYRFVKEQREVVEQLLRLLVELADVQTAGEVIESLQRAAGNIAVEQVNEHVSNLRASHFTGLGELDLTPRAVPDVSELLKENVHELQYDPTTHQILGTRSQAPPERSATGVSIVYDLGPIPLDSPAALVAYFEARAPRVEVPRSDAKLWVVRVTGFPFATGTANLDWQAQFLTGLRESLTLSIDYDAAARTVRRAEFRGIGPADGRIVLDIGRATLNPERLQSSFWVTPKMQLGGEQRVGA